MATDPAVRSILRILSASSESPTPVGTGFLVADRHALTCAHVVNEALGRDPYCPDRPTVAIPFDLAATAGTAHRRVANVIAWHPASRAPVPGQLVDIALLELAASDTTVPSLHLSRPSQASPPGYQGWAFGFPDLGDTGVWAKGALAGQQWNDYFQINDVGEPAIAGGFSGGPFLDEGQVRVIGMVVARHRHFPVSYLIPAATLTAVVDQAVGAPLTLALDNPLIVAPAAPWIATAIGARGHVGQVSAQLRRLLVDPRLLPQWACNGREFEVAMQQEPPPDLIYCYAQLNPAGHLLLGKYDDLPPDHAGLSDLVRRLRDPAHTGRKPLLWLHLITDREAALDPDTLASLRPLVHLLVVQRAPADDLERSLQDTLDALAAMAKREEEPAAILDRLGPAAGVHYWLGAPRLRLAPADPKGAMIAEIRAVLIRVLLGRAEEKGRLRNAVDRAPPKSLLLYALCGDDQSCVHELPEQARRFIEHLNPRAQVEPRPIPFLLHPDRIAAADFRGQLKQDLNVYPGRTYQQALGECFAVPANADTLAVLALSWLLEVPPDLTVDRLAGALVAWREAMTTTLNQREIPNGLRILCGACIQWPDGWPQRHEHTAQAVQTRLDDDLLWGNSDAAQVYPIQMTRPLDVLTAPDLSAFYGSDRDLRRRLGIPTLIGACAANLPPPSGAPTTDERRVVEALGDYLLRRTGGRFEPTAELIYAEYKTGYADFQNALNGSDPA